MHEGKFTEEIVDAVLSELEKTAGKPLRIRVRVGEMLHLEPESVRLHFEAMTRDTRLDGAELELEEIPVLLACRACAWQGGAEDHHVLFCAACGSTEVNVLAGRDVRVDAIDLETEKV